MSAGGEQAVLYLKHLKTMLGELGKDKLGELSNAAWPQQIIVVASQSGQADLLLAALKMMSPLSIHLNAELSKALQAFLISHL